jgi:hypothetical protein
MILVYLKLITGEETVAEQVSYSNGYYVVKNPRVITLIPTQTGGMNVTLVPLMWSAKPDTEVRINESSVVSRAYDAEERFERMFLQSTSKLDLTTKL